MPDARKTNLPDSDETSRREPPSDEGQDAAEATDLEVEGLQTSNKSGKHSSVEKLAASRPEFGAGRDARAIPGAFGDDDSHAVTGRNAAPGTNQFRCSACGRYFNTAGELAGHEGECRLAKASTEAGRESLQQEDTRPHTPNDAESKTNRFQHGSRRADEASTESQG